MYIYMPIHVYLFAMKKEYESEIEQQITLDRHTYGYF